MKRYGKILAVLIIAAAVCLFFANKKSGYHIDEIYSFGLANSYYAPYITDIKDGDIVDKVFTRQELIDYLTVGDDDAFAFGSVYYNQTQDVHPPLFYWLLNFVSSVCRNVGFSKWPALIMNLVIYIGTLFLLYKLASELFDDETAALAAVIIYALSAVGISTFLLIRMYALLAFWTVLLALLILRHLKSEKNRYYPLIFLTVFAGMMTQYYFVFYAFFVCLAYDIYLLISKKYKSLLLFSLSAVCGVAAMVISFPACIDHIFTGNGQVVSGSNALENLSNISSWLSKFSGYMDIYLKLRIFVRLFILLLFCAVTILIIRKEKLKENIALKPIQFIIIIPAFLAAILVFIVSPVIEQRYVYNILPIIILSICPLFIIVFRCLKKFPKYNIIVPAVLTALILVSAFELKVNTPDYLFKEENDYSEITDKYTSLPCVYFDDNYFAPITADITQLLKFDEFLVVNDSNSEKLKDYLSSSDEYITFIDNSWYWSGGVYYELVRWRFEEDTGYSESEPVYEHGLSITYTFAKPDN